KELLREDGLITYPKDYQLWEKRLKQLPKNTPKSVLNSQVFQLLGTPQQRGWHYFLPGRIKSIATNGYILILPWQGEDILLDNRLAFPYPDAVLRDWDRGMKVEYFDENQQRWSTTTYVIEGIIDSSLVFLENFGEPVPITKLRLQRNEEQPKSVQFTSSQVSRDSNNSNNNNNNNNRNNNNNFNRNNNRDDNNNNINNNDNNNNNNEILIMDTTIMFELELSQRINSFKIEDTVLYPDSYRSWTNRLKQMQDYHFDLLYLEVFVKIPSPLEHRELYIPGFVCIYIYIFIYLYAYTYIYIFYFFFFFFNSNVHTCRKGTIMQMETNTNNIWIKNIFDQTEVMDIRLLYSVKVLTDLSRLPTARYVQVYDKQLKTWGGCDGKEYFEVDYLLGDMGVFLREGSEMVPATCVKPLFDEDVRQLRQANDGPANENGDEWADVNDFVFKEYIHDVCLDLIKANKQKSALESDHKIESIDDDLLPDQVSIDVAQFQAAMDALNIKSEISRSRAWEVCQSIQTQVYLQHLQDLENQKWTKMMLLNDEGILLENFDCVVCNQSKSSGLRLINCGHCICFPDIEKFVKQCVTDVKPPLCPKCSQVCKHLWVYVYVYV
ncbi:hypothetical protein RFI_08570, partial [Reticulomyxa filosa]